MGTGRGLHIDVPLSNLAVKAFDSGMEGFIADKVFPITPVAKQSDIYYTITKEAFLRQHDTRRAPKGMANRIEFDVSSAKYYADEYALGTDTALQDLDNADSAIMLRENNNMLILQGLARDKEIRVANTVTSISNVGSGAALTGGDKWNDYVGSDPVADVTTAHAFIRQNTGIVANTGIIDEDTLAILKRNPAILDMYKYTSGGELTNAQIMEVFKIKTLLVGSGIKENAIEGGTSSITNIWGNNFVLAHIKPPTGLKTATFGLGMRWSPSGFPSAMQVTRQRFAGAGTRNIEVQEAAYFSDERIVAADLAYAITGTL